MKKAFLLSLAVVFLIPAITSAAVCYPTDYYGPPGYGSGSRTLNAARVDPTEPVTGEVDAAPCDIGVFYSAATKKGLIQNADIHGAGLFGVVVYTNSRDVTVDVVSSSIHDIGTSGAIPGIEIGGFAVVYEASGAARARGRITRNTISWYQYRGVYLFGFSDVQVTDNIICGKHNAGMAQQGIYLEYALGRVTIERNTITNNLYTGTNAAAWLTSAGIMIAYAPNAQINENVFVNNQYGIYIFPVNPAGEITGGPPMPMQVAAITNNRILCDDLYVVPSAGQQQAGVFAEQYANKFTGNLITGKGYVPYPY